MIKRNPYVTIVGRLVLVFFAAVAARADSLTLITSASAQRATDLLNWSAVGGDQTLLKASFGVYTSKRETVQVTLGGPNSVLSKVCSATPCSWTGAGMKAGDTLLWTSDAGNGGTGAVTLSFRSGVSGAGAQIQADGPGRFTAKIQAYDGKSSLGSFTVSSDSQGHPVYLGLLDETGPHITSVVFSLTSVSAGLASDFGLDTVSLAEEAAAPVVSLSPTRLSFSNQRVGITSSSKEVTLKNVGTASMVIRGIDATGDFKETNNCPSALSVGASCVITVTFHPMAKATRIGAVWVADYAKGTPQTVLLTGTGK